MRHLVTLVRTFPYRCDTTFIILQNISFFTAINSSKREFFSKNDFKMSRDTLVDPSSVSRIILMAP
jgi:hypothetical protein